MAALLASALLAAPAAGPGRIAQWDAFLAGFVTEDGRVRDTGNGDISHSEGQAYAMLVAASLGRRADFDRLWTWTRRHLAVRTDGLLAWRWDPATGGVTDRNNATDGDLVAAWALVRAARRWPTGSYQRTAARLLDAVESRLVVDSPRGLLLLPAAEGFDDPAGVVVNPSYWVFPALQEIALARPAGPWRRLARTGRALLGEARFGEAGLPPDWLVVGERLAPWSERPARFGYDALRVPLYACWAGYTDLPALAAIGEVWTREDPPAWIGLDPGATAEWSLGAGGRAVRALVGRCLGKPATVAAQAQGGDYYESIVALLAGLAMDEVRP